jgi:hypothetical protein
VSFTKEEQKALWGNHGGPSVRPSVCDLAPATKPSQGFYRNSVQNFLAKVPEFRKNGLTGSNPLLTAANGSSSSSARFVPSGHGSLQTSTKHSATVSFRASRVAKGHTSLLGVNALVLYPHFSHLLTDLDEIRYN